MDGWASVPLAVRIRVTDRELGTPVQGARVLVPGYHEEAFTGADWFRGRKVDTVTTL